MTTTTASSHALTLEQRMAAWDRRWTRAAALQHRGRLDLAFTQFWGLTCDAVTVEDETRAMNAAFDCYERLRGPYIPKELQP